MSISRFTIKDSYNEFSDSSSSSDENDKPSMCILCQLCYTVNKQEYCTICYERVRIQRQQYFFPNQFVWIDNQKYWKTQTPEGDELLLKIEPEDIREPRTDSRR